MSGRPQAHNRRPRRFWILAAGLIALPLAAGVWLILDRFTAQDSGHFELVTVIDQDEGIAIDQDEGIDQFQTASQERGTGQDNLEPSHQDTSAQPDLTASPERSTGQDNLEPSHQDTSAEPDLVATRTPPQAELGLEDIVREHILELWGGETLDEESDYVPRMRARLESADFDTRRRAEFELAVGAELSLALADDPSYPLLNESSFDDWWSCFGEYGVPPLEEFGPLTQEAQDALMEELGLVGERMEQVQAECWSRARIYAGKDDETDRLLLLQHQYYLDVAQDWVEENPDSVVPLP